MPDGRLSFGIQLKDAFTGEAVVTAGGTVMVTAADDPAKATIYDNDSTGAAKTNPMTPTRGFIEFAVADTVQSVDLYIKAPGGQFAVARGIKPSGPNEIAIDTSRTQQCMVIPFSMDDATANTEFDTGFDEPTNAVFMPDPFIRVVTLDATETINVGTATADSGDPDGFIAGVSVATAVVAKATVLNGSNTLGALFEVQDSANAGDLTHEGHVSGGKSIAYTLSAGSDTAEGFIHLPYNLAR